MIDVDYSDLNKTHGRNINPSQVRWVPSSLVEEGRERRQRDASRDGTDGLLDGLDVVIARARALMGVDVQSAAE